MAIVSMKRLRLIGLLEDRDPLFQKLQELGCVEVSQIDPSKDEQWSHVLRPNESTRSEKERLLEDTDAALATLDTYAPAKSKLLAPKPQVLESELFDPQAIADAVEKVRRINGYAADLQEATAGLQKIATTAATVMPWAGLDIPLNTQSTPSVYIQFGMMPATVDLEHVRKDLALAADASELTEASTDAEVHYLLLMCYRPQAEAALDALKPYGFSNTSFKGIVGTAIEMLSYLAAQKTGLEQKVESLKESISSMGESRLALQICHDRMLQEIQKEQNTERLLDTDQTFYLEGWVPAQQEAELIKLADSFGCAYELTEPDPEEYPEVPVKLKSGKLVSSLNTVTNMYALPAYGSVDPNPLMAPFFIFFYGMMMADMGYGLVMMIAALVALGKMKPKRGSKYFCELLFACGVSTFLLGIVTGGFFGNAVPTIVKMFGHDVKLGILTSPLLDPLTDTTQILIGAMVLGFIQLSTGMVVNMVMECRQGKVGDAIFTWFVIFAGLALFVLKIGNIGGVPVVLCIGVLMLIYGSGREAKGFGKVTAVFGAVYNGLTGWFGDILSYSRLMALMLAGSVIAQVFNTLAAMPSSGGVTVVSMIVFIIIFLLGHLLNFGLNLLGCFVHDLRLQCLEFFGKFYVDGGKPFRPLEINTRYVDVENHNF